MNTSTTSTSTKKPGFLINRNFALLWSGQVVSSFGDIIFDTTLVLWIATLIARGQSWAPLAVSGVLVAASIPVFVVGPIAGVFADRWKNKRYTMLSMDALRAILIVLLLLGTGVVPLPFMVHGQLPIFWQLGSIYVVVFLTSTCSQFFNPSSSVLFSDIVEEPYRARAAGLMQTITSLAVIAGPPLAAVLFFTVGVWWVLALNALSFVISFLSILAIQLPKVEPSIEPEAPGKFFQEFSEGIQFYVSNPVLMVILITGVLIIVWNGAFNALSVFFVSQNLHAPASYFTLLEASAGIGLTIGALLAGSFAQRIGLTRMFWSSILLTGILVIIYARLTLLVPALIVVFLIGVSMSATTVPVRPLMLHVTPRELIGRVAAVLTPTMTLASLLSMILAGWFAATVLRGFHMMILGIVFGPIDTILTVTGIFAVLGGFYAMVNTRGVMLKKEEETPASAQETPASAQETPASAQETPASAQE